MSVTSSTPWTATTSGDSDRWLGGLRLVVMREADGLWSWQAWGAGEYEPEGDGEATSELFARAEAEAFARDPGAMAALVLAGDYDGGGG